MRERRLPDKLGVGLVGCGNIGPRYAADLVRYEQIQFLGVTDIDVTRAEKLAAEYGVAAYSTLSSMLEDDGVDIVVNVTPHVVHKEVVTRSLEAGRHVFSEKPLALTYEDARELVDLADRLGLRLGCAPATFMGEAQQTALKWLRESRLGRVRVVYCEINWGRIESWHPNPIPFYEVGPLFDVGLYPLTIVTAAFGPAKSVTAYGSVLKPDRKTDQGVDFTVTTPDFVTAVVELGEGVVVRLTVNFYVGQHSKQKGLEFHGDDGSLFLGSFQDFDGEVEFASFGEAYAPVDLVREPWPGIEWGRGVSELAESIIKGRPHRASGAQAAHVIEILRAIDGSLRQRSPVEVTSTFATPPPPMPWAQ